MAHIYSTWPPCLVTNGPLGPFFSEAGQNTDDYVKAKTLKTMLITGQFAGF